MNKQQIKAQMVALIEEQPERFIDADRSLHLWVLAEVCAHLNGDMRVGGSVPLTYFEAALEVNSERTKPRIIHEGGE